MRSLVRRTVVAAALGGGLIYAGVTGLGQASAATNTPKSPSSSATATTSPSNKATKSTTKHNCPRDGSSGSPSSTATTSV